MRAPHGSTVRTHHTDNSGDFEETIGLNPQLAEACANRAVAYTLLCDDAKARQDADKAVALGFDRALLENAMEEAKEQR